MRTFRVVIDNDADLLDYEVIVEYEGGPIARIAESDNSTYLKVIGPSHDTEIELDDEGGLVSFVRS